MSKVAKYFSVLDLFAPAVYLTVDGKKSVKTTTGAVIGLSAIVVVTIYASIILLRDLTRPYTYNITSYDSLVPGDFSIKPFQSNFMPIFLDLNQFVAEGGVYTYFYSEGPGGYDEQSNWDNFRLSDSQTYQPNATSGALSQWLAENQHYPYLDEYVGYASPDEVISYYQHQHLHLLDGGVSQFRESFDGLHLASLEAQLDYKEEHETNAFKSYWQGEDGRKTFSLDMFIKEWNSVELSSDQYTEMVFKLKYKELHTYLIGETEPTIETYIDAVQVSFLQSPREGSEFLYLRMMLDRESSTTIVRQ